MVTCSVIGGSAPKLWAPPAPTAIVFTPVPGIAKFMVSAPVVALACWMAALRVHWSPGLKMSMSQVPPAVDDASGESRVSLTVKVVAAWAGWAASMRHAPITATSKSAANIFVLSLHVNFSLLERVVISVPSFFVSSVMANCACYLVLIFRYFRSHPRAGAVSDAVCHLCLVPYQALCYLERRPKRDQGPVRVGAHLAEGDHPFAKEDIGIEEEAHLLIADRAQIPLYLRDPPKLEGHTFGKGRILDPKQSVLRIEGEQEVGISTLDCLAQGVEVKPSGGLLLDHE